MIAYLCEEGLRRKLNQDGRNYWDVYIREISEQLGLCATPLSQYEIEKGDKLRQTTTLFLGRQSGRILTDPARKGLREWVKQGGILVGFATEGLDDVFGITTRHSVEQTPDDYTISGYFYLQPHRLAQGVHSFLRPDQALLIVSDIQIVDSEGSEEVARLHDRKGKDTNHPAVTWQRFGRGYAGYFVFDVAQTIWLLHQGKPVTPDPDRPSPLITADLSVLKENSTKVVYADEILFLLQNMAAQYPVPFVYQIPPEGRKIPEALLYWGGDCCGEVSSKDILAASNWMKEQGLPYHVNVFYEENGEFNLEPEDAKLIHQNGHDVSLHYWFPSKWPLTEASVREQNDQFFRRFGFKPVCTVNHAGAWTGWIEPAKWMAACGGKADNSFMGYSSPLPPGRRLNAPFFGFGFGTSYPFYFYDDFRNGNRRIDFLEQPIACYELGHRGSIPPYFDDKVTSIPDEVHAPVDMAVKYHLVLNMFYHVTYILRYPPCRAAIKELLDYIEKKGVSVLHMSGDQLWEWWDARSRSTIEEVTVTDDRVRFKCTCEYTGGMVVKVPLENRAISQATCDGSPTHREIKKEFGRQWVYVPVPSGTHVVEIWGQ